MHNNGMSLLYQFIFFIQFLNSIRSKLSAIVYPRDPPTQCTIAIKINVTPKGVRLPKKKKKKMQLTAVLCNEI